MAELHSINPPVIAAGKTTQISVRGVNLDDLKGIQFSTPGISGKPEMLPESEYRLFPRQNGSLCSITVPPDFSARTVELRTHGYFGLSTSRPLVIVPPDSKILSDGAGAAHHELSTAPELPREAFAHGTTDANKIDWWRMAFRKGDRVILICQAEYIDSQADATLKVVDQSGYELETNRDYDGRDPLIDFTAPKDGNYWIGVHDFLYNGGPNFNYVLRGTTTPWIDAVFPPAGKPGETYEATIIGRNLPGGSPGEGYEIDGKPIETAKVKISVPGKPPVSSFSPYDPARSSLPTFPWQLKDSNRIQIGFSDHDVKAIDIDKDDLPAFHPPVEIVSRFHGDHDSDQFRFLAKKGKTYQVEIIGERVTGNSDPFLVVDKVTKDGTGKESFKKVRDGDDLSNPGGNTFYGGSRDTVVSLNSDHDGEYRVSVVNQYASGGPEKIYRLVIRESKPDFEVTALGERSYIDARQAYPATIHLRKGGTFPLRLLLNRKDGFSGAVTISAKGLPTGVACPPVTLSAKDRSGRIVFTAEEDAPVHAGPIGLIATSDQGDIREVSMGTLVWGGVDYNTARLRTRLVPDIPLSVSEDERSPATIEITERKLSVAIGKKLEIPIKLTTENARKGNLTITPVGLRGLTRPPSTNIAQGKKEGKLVIDFTGKRGVFNPEPGTWTFILKGTGVTTYSNNPESHERAKKEQEHVEGLVKKYTDAVTAAKADVANKQKSLNAAKNNLSTASPDARTALEQAVAAAETELKKAEAALEVAEGKMKQAQIHRAAAASLADSTKRRATRKDVKFATWSLPITVEVTEN